MEEILNQAEDLNEVGSEIVLTEEELGNLRLRKMLLEDQELRLSIHKNEYRQYINLLIGSRGLDTEKSWNISLKTGAIEEKSV